MVKRTRITHSDGSETLIEEKRAWGCGTLGWILLVLFLIVLPASAFPPWLAVICYIIEGLVVLAFVYRNRDAWQSR